MIIVGIDVGILTVICLLLLGLTVWSVVKLIKRLHAKKDWQYQAAAIILLLVVLGAAGYFEGKQQYINYWASEITRRAVGRDDVSSKCVRTIGDSMDMAQYSFAIGWVYQGDNYSKLYKATCDKFYEWLKTDREHMTDDQAYLLHLIIHEAMHVAGEFDESEAEYKATEIYEDVVVSFGVDRGEAEHFVERFKKEINPRKPEQYRVDWDAKEREKEENIEAEEQQ